MTEELLTHPNRDDLAAFALGTLEYGRTPEVEEHLAGCSECQELAAIVPGDTFVAMLASAKTELEEKPTVLIALPVELPTELSAHGRYTPLRLLGVGGMGTVWLAEHALMGRQVAIKVIRPEFLAKPGAVNRFRREVSAAARLHHPNIVVAFDAEQAGGTYFLAMEYIDGIGLDELVKEKVALPVAEACRYIADAARGLDHAHRLNVVHRDVKPSNLMRLYDIYEPLLHLWITRAGVVRADADDLVQEVMIVIVREVSGFVHQREGSFRAWLRVILAHRLQEHFRDKNYRPIATGDSDFHARLAELESPATALSQLWDREHDAFVAGRLMKRVRGDFAPVTWQAFTLQVLEGERAAAVALKLELSLNSVLLAKSRVLKRLRGELRGLLD